MIIMIIALVICILILILTLCVIKELSQKNNILKTELEQEQENQEQLRSWLLQTDVERLETTIPGGIVRVAIYETDSVSRVICHVLQKNSKIQVCYFVDEKADNILFTISDLQVLELDEMVHSERKVDAVIVHGLKQEKRIKEWMADNKLPVCVLQAGEIIS